MATSDSETQALTDFGDKLEEALSGIDTVTGVEQISIGTFGLTVEGVGDVSLSFNKTGESPL